MARALTTRLYDVVLRADTASITTISCESTHSRDLSTKTTRRTVVAVRAVKKSKPARIVPVESIARSILVVRGHKVLLDKDLAALYGVATKVLLQAVRRNRRRFPKDFLIQLTEQEWTSLRSQIVTSNPGRGGRRFAPYVFSEQGVAMLSSVLGSERAIAVNIEIMRAFVKLREVLSSNKELARRFDELEARLERKLTVHDEAIAAVLSAIRQLMNPTGPRRRPIGFTADLR